MKPKILAATAALSLSGLASAGAITAGGPISSASTAIPLTGLMERLVTEFTARGLTVSTVKHTHHRVDLDQPGKDSYRHREAGAQEVCGWFREMGWEAHAVPFPPYFVHLDVSFAMAAPGLAAVCEDALPARFLDVLTEHQIRTIPVSYKDAMALGCNIVALGEGKVLSTRHNTRLNARLEAEGLSVYAPDLSYFTLGGGGPHCLCQALARDG